MVCYTQYIYLIGVVVNVRKENLPIISSHHAFIQFSLWHDHHLVAANPNRQIIFSRFD